jgi:hypothetical protein
MPAPVLSIQSPESEIEMSSAGHRKPLINGEDLSELREGRGFRGVWNRCLRYVLRYRTYGRILSEQDGEDIVSEAFQEEMSSIMNRDLSAEEVSIPLARALNRNRARVARGMFAAMSEAPDPATREDPILAIHYKDTARKLLGYIGQAVDHLKTPYRDSIIEQYRLSRFGFQKQGVSPEPSSENARKVARHRARRAFLAELDMLLRQAVAEGEDPDLIRGVRVLIQSRGLAAPVSRKPPQAED